MTALLSRYLSIAGVLMLSLGSTSAEEIPAEVTLKSSRVGFQSMSDLDTWRKLHTQRDNEAVIVLEFSRVASGKATLFTAGTRLFAMRRGSGQLYTCYRRRGDPDCYWTLTQFGR